MFQLCVLLPSVGWYQEIFYRFKIFSSFLVSFPNCPLTNDLQWNLFLQNTKQTKTGKSSVDWRNIKTILNIKIKVSRRIKAIRVKDRSKLSLILICCINWSKKVYFYLSLKASSKLERAPSLLWDWFCT